ncbi:hypothetical protein ACFY8W_31800 [Streptomyces sp. NPDC012637]|uniref:hypothetical protein n=1 Tax=Streptomyces sp. NPDC012637 TaxID=3364842 RepID=UPI0036E699A0
MTSEEKPLDAAIRGLARGGALARAVELWRPGSWLELDERIRSGYTWRGMGRPTHPWLAERGRPTVLRALLGSPTPSEAELALALCDGDGRIRAAALPHAAGRPAVLPLVAVRTADWAAPVRDEAHAVLAGALPGADAGTLAVTAPVILRLRARLRGGTATALLGEVLRAAPPATVAALLLNRDRATRRFALDVGVERGLLTPAELAGLAAYDTDVVVRDKAASAALAAGVPDETLPVLLAARSGTVRSAGVTALRKAGRAAEAEPSLYDRSALVRACARWVLRQDGRDPLPLYRAACTGPATVPGRAPLGLAECGDRNAGLPVLWELTGHAHPLVRSSAVAGLRVLEAADHDRLLALLNDPAPGVVREAARALLPWADRLPEDELVRRTGPGRPVTVRVRALRLLRAHGSAAYEETARRLARDPDPELRTRIRRTLGIGEAVPRPAEARSRLWRT